MTAREWALPADLGQGEWANTGPLGAAGKSTRGDYHPYLFVGGPRHGRFYATNGARVVFMPIMPDLTVAAQQSVDPDPTIRTAEYELHRMADTEVYLYRR